MSGADRYKRRPGASPAVSDGKDGPERRTGTQVRGPLTGIEEPEYSTLLPWQTQYLGRITRGLRSEGVARRGSIILLTFLLAPFVVIGVAAVLNAIF